MRHVITTILIASLGMLLGLPSASAQHHSGMALSLPMLELEEFTMAPARLPRAVGHLPVEEMIESFGKVVKNQAISLRAKRYFTGHQPPPTAHVDEARRRLCAKHWALPLMYSFGRTITTEGVPLLEDDPTATDFQTQGNLVPQVNLSEIGAKVHFRF